MDIMMHLSDVKALDRPSVHHVAVDRWVMPVWYNRGSRVGRPLVGQSVESVDCWVCIPWPPIETCYSTAKRRHCTWIIVRRSRDSTTWLLSGLRSLRGDSKHGKSRACAVDSSAVLLGGESRLIPDWLIDWLTQHQLTNNERTMSFEFILININ